MIYILDTNAVIAVMKGHPGLLTRLRSEHPADVTISSIVAHELYYGAYASERQAENLGRVEALRFQVLEFDREDARCAGAVRAELRAAGTPIGPYDILIAGQALARSLVLVTRNLREFERVATLRLTDWEAQ